MVCDVDVVNDDPVVAFYEDMPFPNNLGVVVDIVKIYSRLLQSDFHPKSVLVVGCGTGEDILAAQQVFPSAVVVGVEPSVASAVIAKKVSGCVIYTSMIEHFTTTDHFDLVICTGVLHHLVDPQLCLRKMKSFLSSGGRMWLGVYHHTHWDFDTSNLSMVNLRDYTEHPRVITFSWHGLHDLVKREGFQMKKNAHRLPACYNRFTRSIYDGLFSYTGQSMIYVVTQ